MAELTLVTRRIFIIWKPLGRPNIFGAVVSHALLRAEVPVNTTREFDSNESKERWSQIWKQYHKSLPRWLARKDVAWRHGLHQ